MVTSHSVSTFGTIYHKALQSQLQIMGNALRSLRDERQEDINAVASAINLRPGILEKIENGEHDLRIKTLFTLCEYYGVDVESILGQGELLHFKLV